MRRIGFRRLLPPVQLVLFGSLLWFAHLEKQRQEPCIVFLASLAPPAFAQESVEIPFGPPCRTLKAELIANAMDLPAVFAGVLAAAALRRETDSWQHGASAPAVVLL